jgi:tRNA1(Val) A37 N6-methylase TrmN6
MEVTDDALIGGRLRLLQPAKGHRAGHDALLLAATAPEGMERIVDFGAGVGTVGLAVALRLARAQVTLVEIAPEMAALAQQNASRQEPDVSTRVRVVEGDVAQLGTCGGPAEPTARSVDLVMMNPPFNDPARHRISPNETRALAHHGADDALEDWLKAADRVLVPGGMLRIIHRPEALGTLLALLEKRAGAVTIRPVHPKPDAPAIRVLIGAIKGRRTPVSVLPGLVLADAQGRPSATAERLLRDGAGLED